MHPVAEVDVPMSCWSKHYGVARSLTLMGMAGLVFVTVIGFDFGNDMSLHNPFNFTTDMVPQ